MDCAVCICKKYATEKKQNIINKISVNNDIEKSKEDLSISLLESSDSTSTENSCLESNSHHSIDSDEVSDILNCK